MPPQTKPVIRVLLALVVIGVIAVAAIYVFIYNKPHPDFEKMKPAFSVNASDLYQAYKTNTAVADKKFTGRFLEIAGTVTKTEVSDSLVIMVFVFEQGPAGESGIRCTVLPNYKGSARLLSPGTFVNIKGNCNGYTGSDVIMEQCSFTR